MWFNNLCFILPFFYFCSLTTNAQNKCRGENEKRIVETGVSETEALVIGGTSDTCIVAMFKMRVKSTLANQYCEENFPQGSLMMQENVATLQEKWEIVARETNKEVWYIKAPSEDGKCSSLKEQDDALSVEATYVCDDKRAFLCQFKIQYNCAWTLMMNDDAEIEGEETEDEKTVIRSKFTMRQINDHGHPKHCSDVPKITEVPEDVLKCKNTSKFEKDWSNWSDCSHDCTEIEKESPFQSRRRRLAEECRKNVSHLDWVFQYNNRTCNTHVLCSNSMESTNAEMARSSAHVNDSKEEELGGGGMTTDSKKNSPVVLIIAVVAAVVVLILLVLLIVAVVLFVKSARKGKKESKQKESARETSAKSKSVKTKTDTQSTKLTKNQTKRTNTNQKSQAKKK